MIKSNNRLPDWIKRQASLGPNVSVDGEQTDDNSFWYLLTVCCPLIFESYAIILHPFWINWKVKELVESGFIYTEEQTYKRDFQRVSWREFFKIFDRDFDFDTANLTQSELKEEISKKEWPVYIWYPAEGDCETLELKFVIKTLVDLYGNQPVNYYYCLLKTESWDKEIIYNGSLTEFDQLKTMDDVRDNPTAIYPDDQSWCIVTDYDLPFTYIGGSKELIHRIIQTNDFDIYEIEPKFEEKE